MEKLRFATKSIHSGFNKDKSTGASSLPVYETASFNYQTAEGLSDVFKGKEFGYIYSRIANPTVTAFERKVTSLENGLGSIASASGMSAIMNVIFTLTESGDEIISSKSLFGGTIELFDDVLKQYGVKTNYVEADNIDGYKQAVTSKTRLIFLETIGNPKLDVPDIKAISSIAEENNIPLVVDSTVTTPYLFKALAEGAHITVHSTTKYITGNGTAIGGILVDLGQFDWTCCKSKKIREFSDTYGEYAFLSRSRKKILQNTGGCLSPFNAFLSNIGLETLQIRMEKHCSNTLALAEFLSNSGQVVEVNYPGLPENKYHKIAARQFNNLFGGLLTFRLGTQEKCFKFINNMKLAKNLANLGDVKTLVIHPGSTIYHSFSESEKLSAGVTDDLIRVSVGIEDIEDIKNDFNQALEKIK